MKIHATRVHAPTALDPYATKWQVAVAFVGRPGSDTFDEVQINGPSIVQCDEQAAANPRVWIQPIPGVEVVLITYVGERRLVSRVFAD